MKINLSLFAILTFAILTFAIAPMAQANNLCQTDPGLKRAVTDTQVFLETLKLSESLNPSEISSHLRQSVNGPMLGLDPVIPYYFTHEYYFIEGQTETSIRRSLAIFNDFALTHGQTYAQYVAAVGYAHASDASLQRMTNVPNSELERFFKGQLQSFGCNELVAPSRANAEDCADLNFDQSSHTSIKLVEGVDTKPLSISNSVVKRIDGILNSADACPNKRTQINALFTSVLTTSDLDDFLVLTWMNRHQNQIVHSDSTRRMLAAATQLNKPIHGPDYRWSEGDEITEPGDRFFQESAVGTKMFLLGTTLQALANENAKYDTFLKLPASVQNKITDSVDESLSHGLSEAAYRNDIIAQARKSCDERIALLLGGPGAVAAATGIDLDYDHERFHVFKTMHLYPGDITKSHGPVYAPKGYSSASAGATPGIGSYILHYANLGRYKNVTLNFNHLADAEANLLRHRSCPEQSSCANVESNAAGSVRVGSTGGDGGAGDGPYDHSHINLIAADGRTKLNFVDAFCK